MLVARYAKDNPLSTSDARRTRWLLATLLTLLPAEAVGQQPTTDEGSGSLSPAHATSGEFGSWTFSYHVGETPIQAGGAVRVQFPDAWHSGLRNSATPLQATDPAGDHFISASCSRADVILHTEVEGEQRGVLVKRPRQSLDQRFERYVFVVRIEVATGTLRPGDRIDLHFGDRSQGSRGYRAPDVAFAPQPILMAIDFDGSGSFALHSDRSITIESRPGPPAELQLYLPSTGVVNQVARGKLSVVDRNSNPIREAAVVHLEVVAGSATAPESISLETQAGTAAFTFTPTSPGIVRLRATIAEWDLESGGNPCQTHSSRPATRIYWGDLHSHTELSWDGVGNQHFRYARWVAGLDFYARTDHSWSPSQQYLRGLSESLWPQYVAATDAHDRPGEFVTLHAYECSMGKPWGHHNVYFRGAPGELVYREAGLVELWQRLERGNALTIPHHTGKFPDGIRFLPQDEERRRNFEIYSGHGLSEAYDPDHPLAFEHSQFTSASTSLRQPSFAQDAWRQGLLLSTIASSDDHRSQPGKPHQGLVAIAAPELTRDAVFQALYDRRTYATTGARILLEFAVEGAPMGQLVPLDGAAQITLSAIGTARIAQVDLLRWRPSSKALRFEVYRTWQPDSDRLDESLEDAGAEPGTIYYVRLRQHGTVAGLPVFAWSSPIWLISSP